MTTKLSAGKYYIGDPCYVIEEIEGCLKLSSGNSFPIIIRTVYEILGLYLV
jgi:hypothetical protein